jgi:hypothetical protein
MSAPTRVHAGRVLRGPGLIVVRATVAKIACLVGSLLVAALGSTVLLVGRTSKR